MPRLLFGFCLGLTLALPVSFVAAPPAAAAWVETATDGDSFLVRGGVVHDDDYEGDRTEAAICNNCFWEINIICRTFLIGSQGACPGLLARCPVGMRPVEVLRANATVRPPSDSPLWRRTGYSCVGDGGPASTGRIRTEVTGGWRAQVPPLSARTLPPGRTLVRLPTEVEFLSPASLTVRRLVVEGVSVTVRATATRSFNCSVSWCGKLQSRVALFKQAGMTRITARAVWRGTFDALGLENVPIDDGTITQTRSLMIEVRSLRRRLA